METMRLGLCLCFYCYGVHRDLHGRTRSFPTLRSSDLDPQRARARAAAGQGARLRLMLPPQPLSRKRERGSVLVTARRPWPPAQSPRPGRSEEHTSELQSLMRISYAVFCLKKNKNELTNTRFNLYYYSQIRSDIH